MSKTSNHEQVANLLFIGFLVFILLTAGFGGWYVLGRSAPIVCNPGEPLAFVRPIPPCAEPTHEGVTIGERMTLAQNVEEYIDTKIKEKHLAEAAVYFRDLSEGPWFGIDEDAEFVPASLMKLPLAMWFYKDAEVQAGALDEQIEFTGPKGISITRFPAQHDVEPGNVYTIRELVNFLLAESSNDASKVLSEYAGLANRNTVFADLDMPLVTPEKDYLIDVRTYAAFFRVLYNTSYLSRESSQELLATMASSSFREGLVAGVPENIQIAHKFGEYESPNREGEIQLHDCGVVYVPGQPYVLCVMTRGGNYENLTKVIAEISRMAHATVSAK